MSSQFNAIKQHFDEQDVAYEELSHAPAGSALEYHTIVGSRLEQQAKAVFVRYTRTTDGKFSEGFAVIAVPASQRADLGKAMTLLHATSVKLATIEQLKEKTGCNFGELPPLGKFFGLPLLFHEELLQQDKIFFNAGQLDASLTAKPADVVRCEEAIVFK